MRSNGIKSALDLTSCTKAFLARVESFRLLLNKSQLNVQSAMASISNILTFFGEIIGLYEQYIVCIEEVLKLSYCGDLFGKMLEIIPVFKMFCAATVASLSSAQKLWFGVGKYNAAAAKFVVNILESMKIDVILEIFDNSFFVDELLLQGYNGYFLSNLVIQPEILYENHLPAILFRSGDTLQVLYPSMDDNEMERLQKQIESKYVIQMATIEIEKEMISKFSDILCRY